MRRLSRLLQNKQKMVNTILLPGGLGYIGTHTIIELLAVHKLKIVILDNFSNCQQDTLDRLFQILPEQDRRLIHVKQGDIMDQPFLERVFQQQRDIGTPIEGVIHFAAKKNATESIVEPILYYETNVLGTLNILRTMEKFEQCKHFIFSSTAAVYGDQDNCTEEHMCLPMSPYGESKFAAEMLIKSLAKVHKDWKVIMLRYFNPAGAHQSGLIGDWPSNYPGNLFPVIQEFVIGKRAHLNVYGTDFNTVDGSGVRDYLHICDLAKGHVKAFQKVLTMSEEKNCDVFNLGSGSGYSVLEVIQCFEKGLGQKLNYGLAGRREGDMAKLVARVEKANSELGWKTEKGLQQICDSCINFTKVTLNKNKE